MYTELNESTNQNSLLSPKVFKPMNKKTLGTSVLNSPLSPPSLGQYSIGHKNLVNKTDTEKKYENQNYLECKLIVIGLRLNSQITVGIMTWPKTGATHFHAQLGIPDKGRAIKELVVFGKFSHTLLVKFGQEIHHIILNCVF